MEAKKTPGEAAVDVSVPYLDMYALPQVLPPAGMAQPGTASTVPVSPQHSKAPLPGALSALQLFKEEAEEKFQTKEEAKAAFDDLQEQIQNLKMPQQGPHSLLLPDDSSPMHHRLSASTTCTLLVPDDSSMHHHRHSIKSTRSRATTVGFADDLENDDEGEKARPRQRLSPRGTLTSPRAVKDALRDDSRKSSSRSLGGDSMVSENYDPEDYEDEDGEPGTIPSLKINEWTSLLRGADSMQHRQVYTDMPDSGRARARYTVFEQQLISRQISLPLRMLGICLAFITVIFLWETTDVLFKRFFVREEVRLIAYLSLAVAAAICLTLSHQWILSAESSLVPSFAYALCTLYTAMGSWGMVNMIVIVVVPKKMVLFFYATGALISLVLTFMYAVQTRHNVLLDIASCATTMGLHADLDDMDAQRSERV